MADLNSVNLTGTLGRDPELKTLQGGKQTATTSIAVNGFSKDQTDWVNIVAWEKTAAILAQYCHKGDKIAVSGRLSIRAYTDQAGNKRNATEVVVSQLTLLGSKNSGSNTGAPSTPKTPSSWSSQVTQNGPEDLLNVDEIPF